ncbi:hypothetical protein HDV57DRAFT_486575, partial [Trichoderma longibrachiatum]
MAALALGALPWCAGRLASPVPSERCNSSGSPTFSAPGQHQSAWAPPLDLSQRFETLGERPWPGRIGGPTSRASEAAPAARHLPSILCSCGILQVC